MNARPPNPFHKAAPGAEAARSGKDGRPSGDPAASGSGDPKDENAAEKGGDKSKSKPRQPRGHVEMKAFEAAQALGAVNPHSIEDRQVDALQMTADFVGKSMGTAVRTPIQAARDNYDRERHNSPNDAFRRRQEALHEPLIKRGPKEQKKTTDVAKDFAQEPVSPAPAAPAAPSNEVER